MATDLVPVAWGAGEGLPGWVVLGKAGLAEHEDLHLKCVFLGLVRGSWLLWLGRNLSLGRQVLCSPGWGALGSLCGSGELVGRWHFPTSACSPGHALGLGQTFLCPPQE